MYCISLHVVGVLLDDAVNADVWSDAGLSSVHSGADKEEAISRPTNADNTRRRTARQDFP